MLSAAPVFDSAYVKALRQGDPAIEAHFVAYFNPLLLRILRGKVRSADQARELRQETFLRVLMAVRSGPGVHTPERFEFFVLNVCNNILREAYRDQKRFMGLSDLETEPVADFPSPYALVLAQQTRNKVRRMLSQASISKLGILESVFLEGQNKDEICQRLGISRGYLRVLAYREKKRFGMRADARRKRSQPAAPECGPARQAAKTTTGPQPPSAASFSAFSKSLQNEKNLGHSSTAYVPAGSDSCFAPTAA